MVLPIVLYGDAVLRKKAASIPEMSDGLKELIDNMFETMYQAQGVGLAAPQVGQSIRLFVIDAAPFAEDETEQTPELNALQTFKKVFINAECIKAYGTEWSFNEGCLSIPKLREDVMRPESIHLRYRDEHWNLHEEHFSGLQARIIQHEYDHIEGILFTDRITAFKRKFLEGKLKAISKGLSLPDYKFKRPRKP